MTPKYNPRARWYLFAMLIALPWIAMGMPRFSSDFLNGSVLGSIGYILSVLTKQRDLSAENGVLPLLLGLALGFTCLAVGSPEAGSGLLNKVWIFAAATIGFGVAQALHHLLSEKT